ncbi:DNA polymerase III subunit chi [Oceanibium sediminis]|uniref:DNA polymerase III subunit chi n=1 Tax=Oceanibium sediminis TaxID=2026339 RepID=UPI000DD3995F|nr:DNA polymerase III subunit chi [Oceanibium sediminis]
MGEVLFYHLTSAPLEASLPELLTRSLQRGWRCVVRAGNAARLRAVDDMLWTYDDASFLPHGTAEMGHADAQPIYLTTGGENPGGASILMLVDGARVDVAEVPEYDRICLIFNGNEPDSLTNARADWLAVKGAGAKGKYWAQDDGRWIQKAET